MITAMPRLAIAVHDFAAAMECFRSTFGLPVLDFSETTVPQLGAHVAMCAPEGGSNIELMSPANPELPLSQALQKFLDRRGDGLYALMLEAPSPDDEAIVLQSQGLDVLPLMAGAGGRDIHPRSTHGVLIRVYPDNSVPYNGPYDCVDPSVTGITTVLFAVDDASAALATYRKGLGLEPAEAEAAGITGTLTACRAPRGGSITFVEPSPADPTPVSEFLATRGQGVFALVLDAGDVPALATRLAEAGAAVDGGPFDTEPGETHGVLRTHVFGVNIHVRQRA